MSFTARHERNFLLSPSNQRSGSAKTATEEPHARPRRAAEDSFVGPIRLLQIFMVGMTGGSGVSSPKKVSLFSCTLVYLS